MFIFGIRFMQIYVCIIAYGTSWYIFIVVFVYNIIYVKFLFNKLYNYVINMLHSLNIYLYSNYIIEHAYS